MDQPLQLGGVLRVHVDQFLAQHALNAVFRRVDRLDSVVVIEAALDGAEQRSVDHGRRAAAQRDDRVDICHGVYPLIYRSIGPCSSIRYGPSPSYQIRQGWGNASFGILGNFPVLSVTKTKKHAVVSRVQDSRIELSRKDAVVLQNPRAQRGDRANRLHLSPAAPVKDQLQLVVRRIVKELSHLFQQRLLKVFVCKRKIALKDHNLRVERNKYALERRGKPVRNVFGNLATERVPRTGGLKHIRVFNRLNRPSTERALLIPRRVAREQ
ncbi:hypothetical protein SDC9_150207 [bioreactor metagenome]|uniref:Uncharacterized protein n=1 Tax=bioreactor metagenome TaxID=1076179 RepID=A0A645ENG6_9ZZZZ